MATINFQTEGIKFELKNKRFVSEWIRNCVEKEGVKIGHLVFIFTSDEMLSEMNQRFLNHKTLTDILTFPGEYNSKEIKGEMYISIERVKENAEMYEEPFTRELCRVMIHGVLHLVGYKDKSVEEKQKMKEKEEEMLQLLPARVILQF